MENNYKKLGINYAVFYGLWQILVFVTTLVVGFIFKGKIDITIAIVISLVTELVSVFVFYMLTKNIEKVEIAKTKLKLGSFLKALCFSYTVGIAGSIIGNAINYSIVKIGGSASTSDIEIMFNGNFAFMAIYAVILAPIIEEFLFRKLLIDRVRRHGEKVAVILSGVLFGLVHGNLQQFFYACFLGFVFAYVYSKTGKIKYTIALHMCINGISMLLQYLIMEVDLTRIVIGSSEDSVSGLVELFSKDERKLTLLIIMGMIVIAEYTMAFIGLIIGIINRNKLQFEEGENLSLKDAVFNKGIITFFVVFVVFFVLEYFNWFLK